MDNPRKFRVQFTLRALLVTIVAIACSLGAGIWFGVEAALAVVAFSLTSHALIRGGLEAIASPNGLTCVSALLMLFSGFDVSGYGPWAYEIRPFAFLPYMLTTTEPLSVAMIWLEIVSLRGLGLLVGIIAIAQIAFHAPWRWRRVAASAFLLINAVISGLALLQWWRLTDAAKRNLLILFALSLVGTVLVFVLRKLRMAESRRVALADTLAVVSVLPPHLPFYETVVLPVAYAPGAWMLLAGSTGLIAANVWLWFRHAPDTH